MQANTYSENHKQHTTRPYLALLLILTSHLVVAKAVKFPRTWSLGL